MDENSNTATPLRARGKPIPFKAEQRREAQARFLDAYRESANVKYSCEVTDINRATFYRWKAKDKVFAALLADAEPDASDTLEYAAYERGVKGVESYVVSQGHMVYEEIPVLKDDGTPKLDAQGKQVMLRGKPLTERKYSDTLLITLLKARLPGKYKDKQQIDLFAQITTLAETAKQELLADLAQAMTDEDQESPHQG
jgi:hypothetical protein